MTVEEHVHLAVERFDLRSDARRAFHEDELERAKEYVQENDLYLIMDVPLMAAEADGNLEGTEQLTVETEGETATPDLEDAELRTSDEDDVEEGEQDG
jgi:hypothetical protein